MPHILYTHNIIVYQPQAAGCARALARQGYPTVALPRYPNSIAKNQHPRIVFLYTGSLQAAIQQAPKNALLLPAHLPVWEAAQTIDCRVYSPLVTKDSPQITALPARVCH